MHTFCSQNNIPFSAEEDKYYKLKQAKVRFNKFSKALNQCYETARPDVFDTGMSMLEDQEGRPNESQVSPEFTDLRNYVPQLGLAKKTTRNKKVNATEYRSHIIEDSKRLS